MVHIIVSNIFKSFFPIFGFHIRLCRKKKKKKKKRISSFSLLFYSSLVSLSFSCLNPKLLIHQVVLTVRERERRKQPKDKRFRDTERERERQQNSQGEVRFPRWHSCSTVRIPRPVASDIWFQLALSALTRFLCCCSMQLRPRRSPPNATTAKLSGDNIL